MSIVELSFAAFALVGFLGIVGIVVIVTGRGPKSFNWKKNLDKKALKEDKSQTNFLEPEMPKGETEATVEEIDEPVVEPDGAVKLEEKVIYDDFRAWATQFRNNIGGYSTRVSNVDISPDGIVDLSVVQVNS